MHSFWYSQKYTSKGVQRFQEVKIVTKNFVGGIFVKIKWGGGGNFAEDTPQKLDGSNAKN